MKKYILLLLLLNVLSVKAQNHWEGVGNAGLLERFADNPIIKVSPDGVPYVAYRGYPGANVLKFDGSNWVQVGNPNFSSGDVVTISLAFDKNKTPYVAFSDQNNCFKMTVMKLEGNIWVPVGTAGFTPGAASYSSLAFDNNGLPYVAFRDQGACVYYSAPNGFRASVMKFNGNDWEYVGSSGFSTVAGQFDGASDTYLSFDKNNNPYVTYSDMARGFAASVQKFDGTNWVYLGTPGFVNWNAARSGSLAFDKNGSAYIIGSVSGQARILKFDGSQWQAYAPPITSAYVNYASIAFDGNDTLYAAFKDGDHENKATVMKFTGVNWVPVDSAGFTSGEIYYLTLSHDVAGNLYVAYKDCSTHECDYSSVMKYGNKVIQTIQPTLMQESDLAFTVFPNPVSNSLNIVYDNTKGLENGFVEITTLQGVKIHAEKIKLQTGRINKSINIQSLSKGTYIFTFSNGESKQSKKIVVE